MRTLSARNAIMQNDLITKIMNTNFTYELLRVDAPEQNELKDVARLSIVEGVGLEEVTKQVFRDKTLLPMYLIESHLVANGEQICLAIDRDIIERSMDKNVFIHACFSVDNAGRILMFVPSDHAKSDNDEWYSVIRKY